MSQKDTETCKAVNEAQLVFGEVLEACACTNHHFHDFSQQAICAVTPGPKVLA